MARSEDPSLENDYSNCLYACRFCNRSRSAKRRVSKGIRLLDPTRNAWADHFIAAQDHHLRPFDGDADAEYTYRAYELDDSRKVERRRTRWELVNDRLRLVDRLDSEIGELLRLADPLRRRNLQRFREVLEEVRVLRADMRRALRDLMRYAAIPSDHPSSCRCSATDIRSIPAELEHQMIEMAEPYL